MKLSPWAIVEAFRRNHALEHATMHVLAQRHPYVSLAGRAAANGFIIYGDLPSKAVASAAREALHRLQAGESELAIHPRCGTNFVAAGVLAGLSSLAVTWRQPRRLLDRLPRVVLAATAAVLMAQPVGIWLQERVTTSSGFQGVRIRGVSRRQWGKAVSHYVEVSDQEP
jgi:hypothetical protein